MACTKKKSECAGCFGIVEVLGADVLKWNFDSVKMRYPNVYESDWCKILDQIDGQPVKINGNEYGTFRKECPTPSIP